MAFTRVQEYNERRVSGLGMCVGGSCSPPRHWNSFKIKVAASSAIVSAGGRDSTFEIGLCEMPLGYSQGLVYYAYYFVEDGQSASLSESDWGFKIQAAKNLEATAGMFNTIGVLPEPEENPEWLDLEDQFQGATAERNQAVTAYGQPRDGTGIKKLALGSVGAINLKPAYMGGESGYSWARCYLTANTLSSRSADHHFVVEAWVTADQWSDKRNPYWAGLRRWAYSDGFQSRQPDFSYKWTDLYSRPSQIKVVE
jgi:hypothetical protein